MKLKSALKSLDLSGLQVVQQFWQLPDPPENADALDADQWVEHLYPRLQSPTAFRKAFDQLDDLQRNLLCFLAIHGGNMEAKELRKRYFANDRVQMTDTVDALIKHGLLASERWTELEDKPRIYGIPEPYLRFIELPHFWKGYLGGMLRELPTEHLEKIATEGLHLKIATNKRDLLIHAVRNVLTDPEFLRTYVDSLSDADRETLFLILQRRGVCIFRDLMDTMQDRSGEQNKGEAVEHLLNASGLLFLASDNPMRYQNLLRVPRDLYYIITHHFVRDVRNLEDLDAIKQVDPKVQPKIVMDNGVSILRDVVIFAGYVARHSVRRLGNGGIGKKDLKKILPQLSANKTAKYAAFLAFYCIRKKFLVPMGDRWRISAAFKEHLRDSRSFYVDIYSSWFETNEWNEEFIEGNCIHADVYPNHLIDIVELRKIVMENLARIPFDAWIDGSRFIESLLAQIDLRMPSRSGKGRLEKLNRINYHVIESVLCENLYWLGLISLGLQERTKFPELGNRGQSEEESPSVGANDMVHRLDRQFNFNPRPLQPDIYQFHFKINGLGRSILRAAADTPAKLANPKTLIALPFRDDLVHFTVLPNLDVIAPPDLNLLHFFKLNEFSEVRHIDVMSTLAITHDSLRAGMDQGLKDQEIIEFLEASCPNGLPETAYHLINECSNRYGEITIGYAGGFIEVDDPVLLEDLKSNKTLAPFIKDVIQNRVVLLGRGVDVQQVARELQRIGFMPSIDNEYVHTTSEGRLHFTISSEDLCGLMGILRFVLAIEAELDAPITEEKTRPLVHSLRPSTHAQFNLNHYSELLAKKFEKNFEVALKKKISAVSSKYRKQLREFISQKVGAKDRPGYAGTNPAVESADITRMVRFAIENESTIEINYVRTTQEEITERLRPESLNGDRLFAFCESRQSYCAYRMTRVKLTRMV